MDTKRTLLASADLIVRLRRSATAARQAARTPHRQSDCQSASMPLCPPRSSWPVLCARRDLRVDGPAGANRFRSRPRVITAVPVSLVLYSLWVSAWFVFEVLRQFVVTAISPATALRLVAFVFLWAAFFSVGFLYACLSAVHQLLGGPQ